MTIDWTISLSTIISLAVMFAAGVAGWVTLKIKVASHDKTFDNLAITVAAMQASQKMLGERVDDNRVASSADLAEFKLEVAKTYATNTAIREVEERVVAAIDRLGDRLDKIIDGQARRAG